LCARQDTKHAKESTLFLVKPSDDAGNPVLHACLATTEQVPEPFDTLQLEDNLVFDNEVSPESLITRPTLPRRSWRLGEKKIALLVSRDSTRLRGQ